MAAEGKNENGDEVNIYKTPVQVTEGSTAETAIMQVLDYYYQEDYEYQSSYLSSIGKVASADPNYWMFKVNGEEPHEGDTWYSIGDYPLKEHDKISLVYGDWQNLPSECSSYTNDTSIVPDESAQAALLESAKKQQSVIAKKIYEATFQNGAYIPGITDTDSLYDVFSLAQAGFAADDFYNKVASKVVSELKVLANGGTVKSADGKSSYTLASYEGNKYVIVNYAKIALVLSALGQDITAAGGIDLTKKLVDKKIFETASPTTLSRETMILFAMDGTGAAWPSGDVVTRAELINNIVNDIDNEIGYGTDLSSPYGAALDPAPMSIQALAAYYKSAADTTGVDTSALQEKVNRVLTMLSVMQDKSGGYVGTNGTPWTLAQVMTTAGLYGINPLTDTSVICSGKTFFDASTQFIDIENAIVDASLMGYAPAQLLRGLNSCIRSVEKSAGL